jgi:hypothetical protein
MKKLNVQIVLVVLLLNGVLPLLGLSRAAGAVRTTSSRVGYGALQRAGVRAVPRTVISTSPALLPNRPQARMISYGPKKSSNSWFTTVMADSLKRLDPSASLTGKVFQQVNKGNMPSLEDIVNLTTANTGFIANYLLTKGLNAVDDNGQTFFAKVFAIGLSNNTEVNRRIIRHLYNFGVRFSEEEKGYIQNGLPGEIAKIINQVRNNYLNVPLKDLHSIADTIRLCYEVGFTGKLDDIDMVKLNRFAKIPSLSSELGNMSINQLINMTNKQREELFARDKNFEPWWTGTREGERSFFGGRVNFSYSSSSDGLLDVACFVKNISNSGAGGGYQQAGSRGESSSGSGSQGGYQSSGGSNQQDSRQRSDQSGSGSSGGGSSTGGSGSQLNSVAELKRLLYLPTNTSATAAKRAFFAYSKKNHPDKVKLTKQQLDKFKEITNAYNEAKLDLDREIAIERKKNQQARE